MPGVIPFVPLRNVIFKLMNLCFSYKDEKGLEIITKKLNLQNAFSPGILESGKEVGGIQNYELPTFALFSFSV